MSRSYWVGDVQVLGGNDRSVVYRLPGDEIVLPDEETPIKTVVKAETNFWVDGQACHHKPNGARLEKEHEIYEHLDRHPQITRSFGLETLGEGNVKALRLERAWGSVRWYINERFPNARVSMATRLRMAREFAEGMVHLHKRNVTWNDATTKNALVFPGPDLKGFKVKLCDFNTSFVGRSSRPPRYEPRYDYYRDGRYISLRDRETFALGSALYEITEWRMPFYDVAELCDGRDFFSDFFRAPEFTKGNPARDIIERCWRLKFRSARAVLHELKRVEARWKKLHNRGVG